MVLSTKGESAPRGKQSGPIMDKYIEVPKWYEHKLLQQTVAPPTASEIQAASRSRDKKAVSSITPVTSDELKTKALEYLEELIGEQTANKLVRAEQRWIEEMLNSGTLSDKVSALALQVKNHPLRSLQFLDSLLTIAKRKGRRETTVAIDALRDAFMTDLLPRSRKLRFFGEQRWVSAYTYHTQNYNKSPIPDNHAYASCPSKQLLAMWALEDGLKTRYRRFLEVLEEGAYDPLVYIKRARLNVVYELFSNCPEAEETLLALLINKMGDSDRKIASKVQYYLNKLLESNPGMKIPVVKEVERLIFRPHIKLRAQYYALIFLNQIVFEDGDYLLAQALIGIYFTLFKVTITKSIPVFDDRVEALAEFKKKNQRRLKKGKGMKAQKALQKVKKMEADDGLSKKLLGAMLTGISRALPYARDVPEDNEQAKNAIDAVMNEHTGMLFKIANGVLDASAGHFAVVVQALALLFQIMSLKEDYTARFYTALYKTILSPEAGANSKVMMYLNIIFRALKNDTNTNRPIAFVKRLLQVAPGHGTPFLCAVLFLISEISKTQPAVQIAIRSIDQVEKMDKLDLVMNNDDGKDQYDTVTKEREYQYDPHEGDPAFSRASLTALWELVPLTSHYHPSVSRFSTQLLANETISYTGNPLTDFTRIAFLDRFVFKNAKKMAEKPSSVHRPSAIVRIGSEDTADDDALLTELPVNSKAFLNTKGKISETDKFFYQYFKEKSERDSQHRPHRADADEDAYVDRLMDEELRKLGAHDFDMDDDDDLNYDDQEDEEIKHILATVKPGNFDSLEKPNKRQKKAAVDDEEEETDRVTVSSSAFDDDDDEAEEFDDSDDEEAAAAKALGLAEDDDDDDDDLDMDDDDDDEDMGSAFGGDTFASAEDFAELLETSGTNTKAKSEAHRELMMKHGLTGKGYGKNKKVQGFGKNSSVKSNSFKKPASKPASKPAAGGKRKRN